MYAATSSGSRDNLLRTIRFENPDYIPMTFHINDACWSFYPAEALLELMSRHPFLFPGFVPPKTPISIQYDLNARKDAPYRDGFGCVWQTVCDGIVGTVQQHPLGDWSQYAQYTLPDPEHSTGLYPIDWEAFKRETVNQQAAGLMTYGDLRHGHTFQQLCDLRGYENVIFDMTDEEPLFIDLLNKLCAFNTAQIMHFIDADVDIVRIPEDLGMQSGLMLSPVQFRTYIKPAYQAMMRPIREAGKIIHMHSDGRIVDIADDLIEDCVDMLNLQDTVNGIDWIGAHLKGRTCIDLDIDRQRVTPYGTPQQIDEHIRHAVQTVGCREGGLMLIYGLYPGVPLENVQALMDAMERYAGYYAG